MYANDLEYTNGIVNWCASETNKDNSDDSSDDDDSHPVSDEIEKEKKRNVKICVILSGPFTRAQKALTMKKTAVRWRLLQRAMKWLKEHNHLYKDFELPEWRKIKPIVIDDTTEVETENQNVERMFKITAVFPDSNRPESYNGGYSSRSEFLENTLNNMMDEDADATIIARPSSNMLYDYQGENLIKAFPLQFPYGIGGRDMDGEIRSGLGYWKHIATLCGPQYHQADFVCILHNMFE